MHLVGGSQLEHIESSDSFRLIGSIELISLKNNLIFKYGISRL